MKKKMLITIIMIALVVLIVVCVVKFNAFKIPQNTPKHSGLFLTSQIPEIDDFCRAETVAFSSEKNEFIEVKRRMDDLKNIKKLDEAAILVQDKTITKRDIEKFKIVNEVIGEFVLGENSDRLKHNKMKYDVIEFVRDFVLKTEVERTVDMPSQEEISYDIEKEKYLFEQLDEQYKKAYIASVGMSEEEFLDNLVSESIYNWRKTVWVSDVFEKDRLKIKQGASENGLLPEEYLYDDYLEIKVDELVMNADIEIVDPELKVLFEIE